MKICVLIVFYLSSLNSLSLSVSLLTPLISCIKQSLIIHRTIICVVIQKSVKKFVLC